MQVRILSGVPVNNVMAMWYQWTMKRLLVLVLALTGCYAEWNVLKTPRRDPCTRVVENKVVYIQPTCPYPSLPRHPRDPR